MIKARLDAGRLFSVVPTSYKDTHERCVLVTPQIKRHLFGPWESTEHEARAMFLLADFQNMAAGNSLMVSLLGRRHRNAQLGRMLEPKHEVWEFRHQKPSPGLRTIGRFADQDLFVGFELEPRSVDVPWLHKKPIGKDEVRFELMKIDCVQQWDRLFPNHTPIHGEEAGVYLTNFRSLQRP